MAPLPPLSFSPWLLPNLTSTPGFFVANDLDDEPASYNQAAGYISARVLTVGGVTLFLMGLCCIGAVLLRFSRCQGHVEVQAVEYEKARVLDQETIDRSLPIRIWPSTERLLTDSHNQVVPMTSVMQTNKVAPSLDDSQLKRQQDAPRPLRLRGLFFIDKFSSRGTSTTTEGVEDSGDYGTGATTTAEAIPLSSMDSSTRVPSKASDEDTVKEVEAGVVADTEEESCCAICLGDYQLGDRVRVLLCEHEYHAECVDIWLIHKSTHCPLCKRDLLDDIDRLLLASPELPLSMHSDFGHGYRQS